MTISNNNVNIAPPTKSQIARTKSHLEKYGILKNSIDKNFYQRTFLQVLSDIGTIDKLHKMKIDVRENFVIQHSASFNNSLKAEQFVKFLDKQNYKVEPLEFNLIENLYKVLFSHLGTLLFDDILPRTILLDKTATQMNADYDGWEIVIDYEPPNLI